MPISRVGHTDWRTMAATLTLRGVTVKRRDPWGAWALNLLTLGIYGIVYWNRINIELRDHSAALGRPFRNDPNMSVLAMFLGSIVLVPYLVTIATTARRVSDLQLIVRSTRGKEPVSPTAAVLLGILLGAHIVYLQRSLNEIWDAEAAAGPQPSGLTPAPGF
jgi:hypothetical protein